MIIVTGGAGFIGSCLIKELNDNDIYDIIVVDELGHGNKWKYLANKRISQIIHINHFRDIIKNNYLKINKLQAIIHLGACSSTTETNVDYLMDNNFLYTKEIIDFAIYNNIRLIYASSAATYGDGSSGYSDKSINNLIPLNPYGFSKHLTDMYLMNNNLQDKITAIKFFNVYGPNENHKENMQSMVLKSYKQIKETGKVRLFKSNDKKYKDGNQMRDFIYVKDCCKVIMKMLNDNTFTGIYNLGTGKARTWNDLVNAVFNAMKITPSIEYIDMPANLINQYQNWTEADTDKLLTKIKNDFSFTELEDGVNDYVCNYLEKERCF
ncbi:MAG: ADP-glyceromanno-heptose 6-epimerase [Bacteroidetes bacterium]|nr:ADP-glyceromanno-heptose 6-epimerase [Bacteroidota bacterium]